MKIVAKALIFDAAGNVLLLHRSATHPSYAHQPDLPGGIIEAGESPPVGLAREILEETGLTVQPSKLQLLAETKQRVYTHDMLYKVTVVGPRPAITISWEHEKPEWLSRPEMASMVLPAGIDPFMKFALNELT